MAEKFLYEELTSAFKIVDKPEIPPYILNNITKKFDMREYQKEAIQYYLQSFNSFSKKNQQIWELFHMATGSGKTCMMASIILHLYEQGYRNFIFFVNATNIVEKTKKNFLDKSYGKYLFAQEIIDSKSNRVEIVSVDNFADTDSNKINIMFTTIQGLHDRLNTIKENSITYSDFEDKKLVLIADESHHFSASTKKLTSKEKKNEEEKEKTWEDTITRIWRTNKDNILLEFTATCDLKNENIQNKYLGNPANIVYNYPLLDFRNSGYTKDLMNLRTNLNPIDRTIQALLLSQYRLKVFEDNKIANSKPVVLLKASNKIDNLENFYNDFFDFLENDFSANDIEKIRKQASGIIMKMFNYFDNKGISNQDLVDELKISFSKEHTIKIHSSIPNIEEIQKYVNDLENPKNPYRLIMTLDMLHEGWDVLNLFDIVRLYNERKDGKSQASQTTIQEAQLIGRGARYYPFEIEGYDFDDAKYKRKFDKDLENDLRICETLFYHCIDDSKYINEIKNALKETGFSFTENVHHFEYKVKDSFKQTDIYKNGKLFVNEQRPKEKVEILPASFAINIDKDLTNHSSVDALYTSNIKRSEKNDEETKKTFKICELKENLVMAALRKFPVYKFSTLKDYFPNLKSQTDFIKSKDYAGRFEFTITTIGEPTNLDIFEGIVEVFQQLSDKILAMKEDFEGTKEFKEIPLNKVVIDTARIKNSSDDEIENMQGEGISQNAPTIDASYKLDLSNKDWFVYEDNFGTTEEKRFVKYFSTKIDDLRKNYDNIYLIRNERNYHIYSFEEGKRFEPDYILILGKQSVIYEEQQIFIEPKGEHLREYDKWKEDFMLELEKRAECIVYHNSSDKYKILGLPFYTHGSNENKFKDEFEKLI